MLRRERASLKVTFVYASSSGDGEKLIEGSCHVQTFSGGAEAWRSHGGEAFGGYRKLR